MNLTPLFPDADARLGQMTLQEIQLYNWGTFDGCVRIAVAPEGYLITGESGSGKSTILDAHAMLLTPPRALNFNAAAREGERRSKDRSLASYVRGQWGEQSSAAGEVAQFLRSGSTWSVVAETYRDGHGKVVVLAQVLWVRGAGSDVGRQFLVFERDFDLQELSFFPKSDFERRRFKLDLPDAYSTDEFSAYQERFRRLLGIDSDRALHLLHKTMSAKNLGDVNEFMREFMLDAPETFMFASRLVAQHAGLAEAHHAVETAGKQVAALRPARAEALTLEEHRTAQAKVSALSAGVDAFKEQMRLGLLQGRLAAATTTLEGLRLEAERVEGLVENEHAKLSTLKDLRNGQGGRLLEDLERQRRDAESARAKRTGKRDQLSKVYGQLGWAVPQDTQAFAHSKAAAAAARDDSEQRRLEREEQTYAARTAADALRVELGELRTEIKAMERQPSNIPAQMLEVRRRLCQDIGVPEHQIPFVGELLEVRAEEAVWQGAIERALGGFAVSLLAPEAHYAAVSAYVNGNHLGQVLSYYRAHPHAGHAPSVGSGSLVRKLSFADHEMTEWLRTELKIGFDFECVESTQALRATSRCVTLTGQVKHNSRRHTKSDRFKVDDKSRWVLGFDNAKKLAHFKDRVFEVAQALEAQNQLVEREQAAAAADRGNQAAYAQVASVEWDDIDVGSYIAMVETLTERIELEKAAHPDLAQLDADIAEQELTYRRAQAVNTAMVGKVLAEEKGLESVQRQVAKLRPELLEQLIPVEQRAALQALFAKHQLDDSLDGLEQATTQVVRTLTAEERAEAQEILKLTNSIERRLSEFIRLWPAEASGLDAKLISAPDFFAKLQYLEEDGLPQHEMRFMEMLQESSTRSLTLLSSQIEQERKNIHQGMEMVNASLATAAFNPNTHLVIQTADKQLPDVREFRQLCRDILSGSATVSTVAEGMARYAVLKQLVDRLNSTDSVDQAWCALVLDVRRHVEFSAHEIDEFGNEVEVYRSGAGKSGGQRQKLAATCLAAALRYQLGGGEDGLPRYSTVFLDEAFDKADSRFTAMAMNIFKTFGFQLVLATPEKSLTTLEPFIGGACVVGIKNRKSSGVLQISYDRENNRLVLPPPAHG